MIHFLRESSNFKMVAKGKDPQYSGSWLRLPASYYGEAWAEWWGGTPGNALEWVFQLGERRPATKRQSVRYPFTDPDGKRSTISAAKVQEYDKEFRVTGNTHPTLSISHHTHPCFNINFFCSDPGTSWCLQGCSTR